MKIANNRDIMVRLKEFLDVVYINRKQTHISVRCPYCGDSQKSRSSAHLNIRISKPESLVFRCVRCEEAGIVDENFFRDLQVYDKDLLLLGVQNKKSVAKKARNFLIQNKKDLRSNIKTPRFQRNEKLSYLENRFDFDIRKEDFYNYKVITDLKKFFDLNTNLKYTEEKCVLQELHDYGIGFLVHDRSRIIFRSIDGDWSWNNKRYFCYNLFDFEIPDSSFLYTIRNQIDIMSPFTEVKLAEGVFDIIGVERSFFNLEESKNVIFAAVGGKSYKKAIRTIRSLGFLNFDLEIYSDPDVSKFFFEKIKREDPLLSKQEIKLYYNNDGKDFGQKNSKDKLRKLVI
jgi:acyl carrier protein